MTIFKPEGADESLTPLPITIESIRLPITDETAEEETIPIAELSTGSASDPAPPNTAAEPPKAALKMNHSEKMALLKQSKKKSSIKASTKPFSTLVLKPSSAVVPKPSSTTPVVIREDSEETEEAPLDHRAKRPRLTENPGLQTVEADPLPSSTPTSRSVHEAGSSHGTPTTFWLRSPSEIFPFNTLDYFKLRGDDERFKGFSSEELFVAYIKAQCPVNPRPTLSSPELLCP